MSYTIKKTDGTTLATVPENEIVLDKASVALVGRGSTNYGVTHSENFVHLLENFAHTTAPAHALTGQLWYDKSVGAMKVYSGTSWDQLGGGGGGAGADGAGTVFVALPTGSGLALVAGGKVVAAISSADFVQASLPETVQFLDSALPFRSRFPAGLQAGQTLATDGSDYVYQGHVPAADQALYTGGGSPFGATSWVDLGDNTVTLHISGDTLNGSQIVAAFSSASITNSELPATVTVGGNTLQFKSKFPSGLVKGLSFSTGASVAIEGGTIGGGGGGEGGGGGSSLTIEVVQEIVDTSIADAYTTWFAEADDKYATASVTTGITSAFTTATGQSTLSQAIDWILTTATEGSGAAEAGTLIRNEIKDAITGATSFANALSKLNTAVTTSSSFSSSITNLQTDYNGKFATVNSSLTAVSNRTGVVEAQAVLTTNVNGHISGWKLANGGAGQSTFSVLADKFYVTNSSGSGSVPFRVDGGAVYINDAYIQDLHIGTNKIALNSVTVTHFAGLGTTLQGGGTSTVYTPVTYTFNAPYECSVIIILTATQGFPNGDKRWSAILRSDGNILSTCGGAKHADTFCLSNKVTLSPGSHTISMNWSAENTVYLHTVSMTILETRR